MHGHIFPRIPYDEVQSEFIADEIRAGSFDDLAHRVYVNDLVYVEWYATDGLSPNTTGLSAAGAARSNWRIATKHPDAYDAVRREFDAATREETLPTQSSNGDPDARRRWARRHRAEWEAASTGSACPADVPCADVPVTDRPRFAQFRFPKLPYDDLQSEFVVDEIRRGSFDDIEHRQYVNRLVYIEAWTRHRKRFLQGAYPPVRPWQVAAAHPAEYDIVRAELDAPTRADLEPIPSVSYRDEAERRARHRREWQTVQESRER